MTGAFGWDIGGVNAKAARVAHARVLLYTGAVRTPAEAIAAEAARQAGLQVTHLADTLGLAARHAPAAAVAQLLSPS